MHFMGSLHPGLAFAFTTLPLIPSSSVEYTLRSSTIYHGHNIIINYRSVPSTLVSDIDGWSVVGVTVDSEDITNPPPQVCSGYPSNR